MRDSLDGWLETAGAPAAAYVTAALTDDTEIIRRIALYAVTEHFELLQNTFEPLLTSALFTSGHRHELYRLLSVRFGEFSNVAKAAVIAAIKKIPAPSSGDDQDRRLRYTQREWLSSIKDQPEAKEWFAQLTFDPELGASTEHPDFLSYHETRWGPGPAPFGTDSILAFAEDGTLVDQLNEFKEANSWRGPTLGGLVAALEGAVASNPNAFISLLSEFHRAKVPFQHGVIQGFKHLFDPSNDKKPDFDWKSAWPKLIRFFKEAIEDEAIWANDEEEKRADLTPTSSWMRTLIASFLEAATRDDKTAYPPELLPQGWAIIKILLGRAPDSEVSFSDPMTHALNTEKGHAIGALYNHALRVCRLADQTTKSHTEAWRELKGTFDDEIGKCRNGNFEFSTLSASYISNLDYLSRAWLTENVEHLFPATTYPINFKVAIGGLAYGSPTRPIYQLLASHNVFANALAARLDDRQGRERVIEWVALAYLWDDETLETPIVQEIFKGGAGDLETMAEFFWGVRREELQEKQIQKVIAFWERALAWSQAQGKIPERLMSRLSRLSPYIAELDDGARRLLAGVIPYVHLDYSSDAMVEELSRLVDGNPAGVAELLEKMLDAGTPNFDLDDKLKKLIERLAALGLRAEAIRCADKLRRTLPNMLDLYKKLIALN
jgi:hypothetical protein